MKKLLIGFVMAAISAFTFVGTANAAEPKATYVNVLGGYQFDTDNGLKHQELSQDVTQKEHGFVQAAVGVPVSGVNLQLEYAQNKADYSNGVAGKQETTSLVAAIPLWNPTPTVQVYSLLGAGYTQLKVDGQGKIESATGVAGLGLEWRLNPTVSLLAEGRGQYVGTDNYWQPQALVGVKVHPYQVFKNATGK